ncbi:MAG: hypothetical protein HOQ45_02950 [Nocardioidaceae bacterium]|nr:hypothetical protein [Nocardioidaceae bacterium]
MTFEPDSSGINELFSEIAGKIEEVDRELRSEWTGKSADEIEPAAETAFASIGITMQGGLREYAESIERDERFQFNLG